MNVHVQGCNRRSSDSHNMASRSCSFRPFLVCISLCLAKILTISASSEFLTPGFRPPSVPLVVIDPYISVWSDNDHLYDAVPKHWSGPNITMAGMIDIDGTSYRFMSNNQPGLPSSFMEQVDLKVYPTQTKYSFQQDGIQLDLTFSTPAYAVPGQLPYLPLTYLTYDVASIDGQNHKVHLYYDNTAEAAVADVDTMVQWSRVKMNGKVAMRIGSEKQHALEEGSKKINWGFWYVVVPYEDGLYTSMSSMDAARSAFKNAMNESKLPADDMNQPRACSDNWPVLAVMWDLDVVQANQVVSRHLTIVYDQMQSINYFGSSFIPYWKHVYDDSVENLVTKNMYGEVKEMCDMLDKNVTSQLFKVGGANYTTIASLAWRQAVGGTITVWNHVTQEVWMFMKEISSDGDVSTVDVIFPASPLFLWWDYKSIQLMLKPIMEYAMNNTYLYGLGVDYNLPWAPHHLGHWPVCNLEPEDQEQMPMEESGNMLLMIAASVLRDPKHDVSWLGPYWDMLITWGDFIMASLPDPGDQLCTDDFEGKSPHNVNLAAKGIVGLGALSYLLQLGQPTSRALVIKYNKSNTGFLEFWQKNASDGNSTARIGVKHYRLEFNESNTWSLKYNILYQEILKLDLFPDDVIEAELAYYMNHRNTYGIPLDSRANFTKADWQMWIAALGNDDQFSQITDMVYKFAHESEDRFPFCDWYTTDKAKMLGNFYARPVMGGVYAKMLVP